MAMNMPCGCPSAPYCSHGQRQLHSNSLPFLGVGSTGDTALWSSTRMPPQQQHQQQSYSFHRAPHAPLFPSQTLNFLNDQDKLRASSTTYSSSQPQPPAHHASSWSASTYPVLSNEYANNTWLPARTRDPLSAPGSSTFSHENGEYSSSTKYEGLELRDVSPSRATEFSTLSASSQASPAPTGPYMHYGGLRAHKDDSPFLSAQPMAPEQLRAIEGEHRRLSTASFDSNSPSRGLKSRSRKGSDAIHCHVCYRSFDRRSNFKSHWETHDKDRQRTMCKIEGCLKTFGRPAEMTRHVNSAHRQKLFTCSSCGKDFTRHDILLRHCKDACPVLVKDKNSGKKRRGKSS